MQGITYDSKTDSIWYTIGSELINIQKDGTFIKKIYNGEFDYNGLLYNALEDNFFVLCSKNFLLKISKENEILETYNVNFKDQDHLSFNSDGNILITVGNGYLDETNYVVLFDLQTKRFKTQYQVLRSYAVEGLQIIDGKLYVCNDGFYHNAKIQDNYITVYNIEE